MKLCMVMAGNEEGGLEKHFVDLCNALVKDPDIELLAIGHEKYAQRFSQDVNYLAIDLSKSRRNIKMLWQLAAAIKKFNPDVVHAQASKAAAIIKSLKKILPGKKVATLHNLKNNTKMFKGYDGVIAVSKSASGRLPDSLDKVAVIYNGQNSAVAVEPYARAELLKQAGLEDNGKHLCIGVGRFVYAKAFELLLEAWVDIEHNLILVGDGPDRPELERLVAEKQLGGRVSILGFRDDVINLLASSDVCVISSRYEGFPYVMVESLFVKTPIISTKVPGCNEMLPPQRLLEIDDVANLKQGLQQQLADLGSLQSDFESVFEFAEQELTVAAMTRKHLEFYQSL